MEWLVLHYSDYQRRARRVNPTTLQFGKVRASLQNEGDFPGFMPKKSSVADVISWSIGRSWGVIVNLRIPSRSYPFLARYRKVGMAQCMELLLGEQVWVLLGVI